MNYPELVPYHKKQLSSTERKIEVPMGREWLNAHPNSWEIGAVTPYYFPGLCRFVVDPFDPSPLVTHRCSMFDLDFTGLEVLCISTIEHIGEGHRASKEYTVFDGYKKITSEASKYLITAPLGYKKSIDAFIRSEEDVRFMMRDGEDWSLSTKDQAFLPYPGKGRGANAIAIFEKR